MANFANLTAQLNLNIQNFAQNMQKASTLANKFASNLQGKINTGMVEPAKKAKFEFKDVSRIVQGIIISKTFYSGLNAIRRARDAVWEFSKELEYAKMVYSNLFGDTELAQEFINVLKDFAAVTPFSFKQSEEAAKRLLAYGIESKNIMFLMQGVLSAATVQGTDAVIEPISRAMGQIYTKGRLMNEEMRQLAEAGIPVYEILQEKLNLTAEELRNLGRTAIPAHIALNALVEGINERFGATLEFASTTTQGIISNIVDNSTMLFAGIFEPFTEYLRGALGRFGEFINELRSIYELKGIGGVFEKLIPPSLQQDIKVLIANLKILWNIIKSTLVSAFKILGSLLGGLLYAFNALAPAINTVIGILAGLLKIITSNEKLMKGLTTAILAAAAAWVVYRVQAVAASITTVVIKGIVGAIKALVAAMNFVVYHPIWALLALGVGIFVALTGASEKFRNSINNLFKGLYSLGGIDVSKQLLPESKERANDLSKFNKALDGTKKGMDDLASATGKATKAAKSLLGFDEVFSLKSPDEGNAADQWEDFTGIFDGAGLDLSDMQIELPDVGGVATDFVDNLIEALGGKDKLLGAGIGGLLGAALGSIVGGPIGAKIGGIIGAIAGWFWSDLAKKLGLTDVGTIALPISTVLGTAIGFIAGGPLGALIGAAIGTLVGWIIDSIARGIVEGDWSKIGLPVGIGLGAAIGFIAGGPLGALIGAAIGALVGWITDKFIEGFSTGNWDVSDIALGLGTGLGAAIGFIAGGPVGAIIGAAIGALIGWLIGLITDNWDSITDWFSDVWDSLTTFFSNVGSSVGQWFAGVGEWFSQGWSSLVGGVSDFFTGIGEKFTAGLSGIWTAISTSVGQWFAPIGTFFTDVGTGLATFASDLWTGITTVFNDIATAISTVMQDIWSAITTVWNDISSAVSTVCTTIWETISNIFGFIKDLIVKVVSDIWNAIVEWFTPIAEEIGRVCSEAWNAVSTWFTNIFNIISEKVEAVWETVKTFFGNILTSITTKVKEAWSTVSTWFQNIWNVVKEKLSGAWTAVKDFFGKIYTSIKTNVSDSYNAVKNFFGNMYTSVKEKIDSMYTSVKDGIGNIYNSFKNWISNLWDNVFGKFFDWINTGISKLREFFGLDSKAKNTDISYGAQLGRAVAGSGSSGPKIGHATGGIFNREHIARFAEGNKAEAVIPLENAGAMQPFVDAVANGITASLMPIVANISSNQGQLQPLYVGTLIADDRSLRELQRKMQVIQLQEMTRRGR